MDTDNQSELEHMLGPHARNNSETPSVQTSVDAIGLRNLIVQHFSTAFVDGTAEFALYLYLITYFQDTLLPSSMFGFSLTVTGILLSQWAGSLVDKIDKLRLVRRCIIVQKLSTLGSYLALAALFQLGETESPDLLKPINTLLFGCIVLCGCILRLSSVTLSIAVERDWATCISRDSSPSPKVTSANLSKINTWLRQTNLICRLGAPLFVSYLTTAYDTDRVKLVSVRILGAITLCSLVFELYWIKVVYRRFPVLADEQARTDEERARGVPSTHESSPATSSSIGDWLELVRLPVFYSSLALSLLYLTVLSFDGTMLGYLKTLGFSDAFIAVMRGVCVVTGLFGTMVALPLEKRLHSDVRAGNWSIWSMVVTLFPALLSFAMHRNAGTDNESLGPVGSTFLFGGMALSRIGLWSFDLIQTKQMQSALQAHPKRNTLTALQFTMHNIADLAKYILTMALWKPSQFRYAALASYLSITTAACVYGWYVKKERGHVVHLDCLKKVI